tara:strand:- start:72 stop:476 length:405 start_codon:yes stop_codon:yes gene_type:complete
MSIFLGGTGSANELDDYEEGTHQPQPVLGGINSGVTDGKYTKIGDMCFYIGSITPDNTSSSGNIFQFSLPFTAASGRAGSGVIRYSNHSSSGNITFHVDASQAKVSWYEFGGGTFTYAEAGGNRFDFAIFYKTA